MNINPTGASFPTQYLKQQIGQRNQQAAVVSGDQVHTSKQMLALSRALATLKSMSLPREDVLQKFNGELDSPATYNDDVIDHIIGQL